MIRTVDLQGYRGFSQFEMSNLGRINLLVGKNNSGKTSLLEALDLLGSNGDPFSLWNIISRRGERIFIDATGTPRSDLQFEVNHLFSGHELKVGANFSISAKNDGPKRSFSCRLIEVTDATPERERSREKPREASREGKPTSLYLLLDPGREDLVSGIQLTRRGTLRYESIDTTRRGRRGINIGDENTQFVTTESLGFDQLALMWNEIALTDAQRRVVSALKFIDARVEQIAPLVTPNYYSSGRGGFIVKLSDSEMPVPIGSLGDGMWRILALAISISRVRNGILLVDEIDTGLHYSVMAQMWRLIYEAAKLLNVQVFATTHSYDCVHSLATICEPGSTDITIQRIEAGKKAAIHYSAGEIKKAAEMHIEMR